MKSNVLFGSRLISVLLVFGLFVTIFGIITLYRNDTTSVQAGGDSSYLPMVNNKVNNNATPLLCRFGVNIIGTFRILTQPHCVWVGMQTT